MHYVLDLAGAAVLAVEDATTTNAIGYRHDRTLAIGHSLRLSHTVGVNGIYAALVAVARHSSADPADAPPTREVTAWWPETRCTRLWGDLARPDAYARWHEHGREVEFFLEYDTGTEPLTRLAGKLHDYAKLATATGITTPVLFWLPSPAREATARPALAAALATLSDPDSVPVATTAAASLGDPVPDSPAAARWLPLAAADRHNGPVPAPRASGTASTARLAQHQHRPSSHRCSGWRVVPARPQRQPPRRRPRRARTDATKRACRSRPPGPRNGSQPVMKAAVGGLAGLVLAITLVAAATGGVASLITGPAGHAPSSAALTDIPADYLLLYEQAAATCPGLDWAVLAGIGKVESDHGRSQLPGVHSGANSAGAQGPMQFLPATFAAYAHPVPAGGANPPSPYDPIDAIYAAARMLCANGARDNRDVRAAIFAYNHVDWYVAEVLICSAWLSRGRVRRPRGMCSRGRLGFVAVSWW
jgi:hypothetical protein